MNQENMNHQLKDLSNKVLSTLNKLKPYSLFIFLAFVLCVYGFVLFRANQLNSQEPSDDAVNSHVKAAQLPHIDPVVVEQLKTLHDNSVSVQALFDQGRSNPFQ
ncbi:MAG TPA: hypothetical protein VHA05_00640 [Candidatus Saccharimonadales bacterium]|nr:hypothetical protein [Candidatus Saccharimonadales bacterium]